MSEKTYFKTGATEEDLKCFGIYKITNILTGVIYIGSTIRAFRQRFNKHLSNLENNEHVNKPLQNSWNKHGKDKFEFSILEKLNDRNLAIQREQFYIDSYDFETLYNTCKIASSTLGTKYSEEAIDRISRDWVVVSPRKEIFYIKSLSRFCRKNKLHQSNLLNVAQKKSKSSLGWLVYYKEDFSLTKMEEDYNKVHKPKYILTDKDNNKFELKTRELHGFCKKHNLDTCKKIRSCSTGTRRSRP